MGLIQINVVSLEAFERIFHGTQNVGFREPFLVRGQFHADLGGNDDLVPIACPLQPIADYSLGLAALVSWYPLGVHIRRVDQVEARRGKPIKDLERRFLVDGPSKDVAAQSERSNLQTRFT